MRVVTRLARMEFTVGGLARDGDNLVITSGGDERAMKVTAYIQPEDITAFLRVALRPAIIRYVFGLPLLLWRRRRKARAGQPERQEAG